MNYSKIVEELREWFNGDKNYHLGISYLKSYGDKPNTADSLLKYKDPEKLKVLLKELLDECKVMLENEMVVNKPIKNIVATFGEEKVEKLFGKAAIIKKMQDEYISRLKEINILRANLIQLGDIAPEDENIIKQRAAIASRLLELDFESNQQHFSIHYYKTYGYMPNMATDDTKQVKEVESIVKNSTEENLRKNISRFKSKIADAKKKINAGIGKNNTKLMKKINEWESKKEKAMIEYEIIKNGKSVQKAAE